MARQPRTLADLARMVQTLGTARSTHDLHNIAGRVIAREVQAGFASERDPEGRAWPQSEAARREGRKTLRDTGALQDGIKWRADARSVTIYTTGKANVYAGVHQFGHTQVNTHAASGRFRSRASVGRLRRQPVRVSYTVLPQRQFLPMNTLPHRYVVKVQRDIGAYVRSRFGF